MAGRIAACIIGLLAAHAGGATAAAPESAAEQLMSQHLVTVGQGRRINLVCVGSGDPVLLFEQGLGANILAWQKLVEPVAAIGRACFYDRAGYGFSDPRPAPATPHEVARDLHVLLRRAGLKRPVVMIGHSIGGLYATYYADTFPGDVAGLVLVEPSFAGQDEGQDAEQLARDEAQFRQSTGTLRECAAAARAGRLGAEPHPECYAFSPGRTPAERTFLTYQLVRPHRYEAMVSELEAFHSRDGRGGTAGRQARAAARRWGDKPVVVLTAAPAPDPQGDANSRAAADAAWRRWRAGHEALAARSSRGRARIVAGSGHFVQADRPEAVMDAIRTVIAMVRNRRAR